MGSLCGRKTEVCEELRKRKVDVCCIQEVKAKELVLWVLRDEGIKCGGQEMMQDSEGLEFW